MKKFALIFIFCFAYSLAGAQGREIIGRLIDKETLRPISNANVVVPGTLIGTSCNAVGFFKMVVQQNHTDLRVSKIGYKSSVINIVGNDKFQVKIEPGFIELPPLNLADFLFSQPDVAMDSATVQVLPDLTEKDACYKGGWPGFYQSLFEILNKEEIKNAMGEDSIYLYFVILTNNEFSIVKTEPENLPVLQAIKGSQDKFLSWQSALQNKVPVPQNFKLALVDEKPGEVFTVIEETATPVGGMPTFYRFLAEKMRYPVLARRMGVEGKVFVTFVIEKDGTITNPVITKGIGANCDEEALRLISLCPKWNPAKQKGKPVRQRYTLPIVFKLG